MRGPPPKPTVIKAAEGNPGKRRLNRAELLREPQLPACPRWLNARARREFHKLAAVLMRSRVLREEDQIQLACLCDAIATLISAREALEKLPPEAQLLIKTSNQSFQQNPLLSIINVQKQIINRLAAEFGITPASRSRLQMGEPLLPPGESELEKIMRATGEIEDGDPITIVQ